MINLKDQVKQLYSKVRDRFLDYSAKLTKVEDKTGSIVLDFFSRNIFDKSGYNEKNKFLTGI
jgi:Trm5-related predicted tRNA methylase